MSGVILSNEPFGPPAPNSANLDVFGTVKDFASGAFNFGLDFLSEKFAFERQIELLKYQQQVSDNANATNTGGGGYTNPSPTFGSQSFGLGLGGMSPVTIAVLGVAALLILRK